MSFILTQYLQKLLVQSISTLPPSTVQKSRLVMKAHLTPQAKQTMPCRISHQYKSAGVRSDVVGPTT